jgi:lactate dehydrogenase-like 2-hydroxyacid dehydrogenase
MTKPTLLALTSIMPDQMDELIEKCNVIELYKESNPEAKLNEVKDSVQGILATMRNPVRENLMAACPGLEIVSCYSVGTDNVDVAYANANDIIVTNTPDLVTEDTADTALSLLLNVSRRYVEADAFVRVGKWGSGKAFPKGVSPTGKKVGIVGLGRIGKAIARRCSALDMHIHYYGRNKQDDVDYQYFDDLIQMAYEVDYLVLAVPGGENTKHMVNRNVLSALGPKGFLINVARGTVVDELALVEALHNKVIAGAGCDVFENEPHVPDELKTLDNVVLYPHVGASTHETLTKMSELVVQNILLHFDGKPVLTPVT